MPKLESGVVSKANLLRMFVEGAQVSDGKMYQCSLGALNTHLGIFRGHKGKFTIQQAETLLEAAERYMADPANQVDLTRPVLVKQKAATQAPKS